MGRINSSIEDNGWWVTLLHLLAVIWKKNFNCLLSCRLGSPKGLNIHPSAHLRGLKHISIGDNFYAGRQFWLEAVTSHEEQKFFPHISIGNNVAINDNVHIAATNYIKIGNNVLMASKIYISDHNHGHYQGNEQSDPEVPPTRRPITCDQGVIIGDNVWIGEFVSVLAGVTIGSGSIIGCNSVVTRDIPSDSIAVGNPAKIIKTYNPTERKWVQIPQ